MGRAAHILLENFAEITAVQLAHVGQLLHSDLPGVVVLHQGDGLLDVEIPELAAVELLPAGGGLDQPIHKQAKMADQMEGGGVRVVGDVEHGVPNPIPLGPAQGAVERLGLPQPGAVHILRRP